MSQFNVDTIKGSSGSHGPIIVGVTTVSGNLHVGSAVTVYSSSGIVSATSYYGSGANLTGISVDSTALKDSNDVVRVQANTSGAVVTGIVTATTFIGALTGDASGSSGSCTGNAGGLTGTPDITVRNITGVAATFSGVITYEDVTNVDSVGIVTARGGFEIGAAGVGGTITAVGNAEFAGITTASKFSGPTNIPGNVTSGTYTIVAADAGKLVSATGTVTLPAATFAVGDAISVYNNTGSDMTLTCSAPTAVYLGSDGSTVTSLTLALRCICTFVCVDTASNDTFVATGGGLS